MIISPYNCKFKVTQQYKENVHKGIDIVGLDNKNIYSTVDGIVEIARWENANDHRQGFGKYVMIKEFGTNRCFIYAHLSEILVKAGDIAHIGTILGVEGDTGYSFGSHCHYEVREKNISGKSLNICEISGIPNILYGIYENTKVINYDLDKLVLKVFHGEFGNGLERKQKLGNLYDKVQKRVNDYINMANEVMEGKHGNYPERKTKVESLGYNYELVQRIVNETLGIW